MSLETAAVIAEDGEVIHWHVPGDRTSVSLPDSQDLWDVIWEHRSRIGGIAHTHPGSGYPSPSNTDVTTFDAIESGLGRRLKWWILSSNNSVLLEWNQKFRRYAFTHSTKFGDEEPDWMGQLRSLSFSEMLSSKP